MGTLSALGRSGALSRNTQNLSNLAISLRQMRNRETQYAQENAINLEKLELLKAADKRATEASDVELRAKKFALDKAKQQDELLDFPVPITQFLGVDYMKDPAKKMIYEKAKEKGWVTEAAPGVEVTTRRYGKAFTDYVGEDLDFAKKLNETNMVNIGKQINDIGMQLLEETNPKKIEQLTAAKKELEQKLGLLAKTSKDLDIEHQKQLELEGAKRTGDFGTVETAEGVFAYNKDVGKKGDRLGGVPPKASANPSVLNIREQNAFTSQYNARRDSVKSRALQISKKYGLTAEEAMSVAEGDASIVTKKMTEAQASKFMAELEGIDSELRDLDEQYNEGLSTGLYKWRKPQAGAPKKKLTYDAATGTFK